MSDAEAALIGFGGNKHPKPLATDDETGRIEPGHGFTHYISADSEGFGQATFGGDAITGTESAFTYFTFQITKDFNREVITSANCFYSHFTQSSNVSFKSLKRRTPA
ncbi:putative uncharacterized protein [Pseudomonas sp. Os17]|nr:putative uncharacterized protein [Pseudomonas sp. Os17]BAQ80844.1 putative uncharacterized protein [Pseudomonas sp. St29]